MPWNTGGPDDGSNGGGNPWGSGGGSGGGGRPGGRPEGPWGTGGGRRGPGPQDIDAIIARIQALIRGLLPGGGSGGGGRPKGGSGSGPGGLFGRGGFVLLVAVVVVGGWLATGFYNVQPDEQGVVLRFGAYKYWTQPGLRWHLPWPIESVIKPPVTRINRIEIGYRSVPEAMRSQGQGGASAQVNAESLMLTGDENIIDINFTVFWQIKPGGAPDFLFNTRNPEYTIKSVSESVMREVIGRTPIQPALTDARKDIEDGVRTGVQAVLDTYGSGVDITQVQLQKVDPPDAVIDSFRDVQRANTDADRMRNEAQAYANDIVPRARGDAAAIVASAQADKEASIATATGQGQRFLSVLKAYDAAKDVTMQRLYLETMEEILSKTPSVVVDDKLHGLLPLLPLGGASAPPAPAPAAGAAPAAPQTTLGGVR